jgi:hypothetical protein
MRSRPRKPPIAARKAAKEAAEQRWLEVAELVEGLAG